MLTVRAVPIREKRERERERERESAGMAGLFHCPSPAARENNRIVQTTKFTNSEGSNWSVNWSLEGVLWRAESRCATC